MRYNLMLLVTRLNGKITDITPIEDMYINCQINLSSEFLTDEDILKFYSHMSKEYQTDRLKYVRSQGKLIDEGEAKDLTCKLSKYSINIEYKEIEFEDVAED